MVKTWSNKPDAENPAIASRLAVGYLWRGVSDPERSMKAHLLVIASALVMTGCRGVPTHEMSTAYPFPPSPLSQFFKNPIDGVYALPKPVESGSGPVLRLIVVSGESIRLYAETNDSFFVEFKGSLPTDDTFQQIVPGTTEDEIQRRFGKPTQEQDRRAYYNWEKIPSDTRVLNYQWCTVSPTSELLFMRVTVVYRRSDGRWTVGNLNWAKWQNRILSSNKPS